MIKRLIIVIVTLVLSVGCQTTTRVFDPDKPFHMDERYDYTDLKAVTEQMARSIVTNLPIVSRNDQPVIIIYGISNRTNEHIDTNALTEKVRTALTQTHKVRFINEDQRKNIEKEIAYQSGGLVNADTRIRLGRQIGAEYMLTGAITSITKEEGRGMRLKARKVNYYKFNMELTQLETSIIEWSDEKEFAREVAKPFIGW
ncbi:MAG: penicillin-binding protein activator LpoB [Bdellovibrio sp.]|nr:penicillin-binding protein activator LpoB [Bdellovibrio sp.]